MDNDKISREEILKYLEGEKNKLVKSKRIPREGKEVAILTINTTIKFINQLN